MKKLFILLFLAGTVSVTGCAPKAETPSEETTGVETEATTAETTDEAVGKTNEAATETAVSQTEENAAPEPEAIGDNSAERAGMGDFDATGQIPCAQAEGQPMNQCNFGVARAGNGTATVVVTKPDGSKRALFFTNGKLTGADTSQADGYGEVSSEKQGDLYMIRVGTERYEIPEAVIYGG